MAISNDIDVSICFVPQWSPFQPPLSIPSLAAWLRRADFTVDVYDANIAFYHFLLSQEAADILLHQPLAPAACAKEAEKREAAIAGIRSWRDFRADILALLRWAHCSEDVYRSNRNEVLADTYRAANSLDTYLRFVTALSPTFVLTPYEFRLRPYSTRSHDLSTFVEDAPPLLKAFASIVAERVLKHRPRIVGLSCIGQEQTIFSLLIGKVVKASADVPVVVGGTVFSRIVERSTLPIDWVGRYIDVIVKNEGERPLEALARLESFGPRDLQSVPGIVFRGVENEIVATQAAKPLNPADVPIPDFDDLPLGSYITSKITLPLLASRGCYWGKCEFCHHGMVYGDKYAAHKSTDVTDVIASLAKRHSVSYFAFNDEAIPPTTLRKLATDANYIEGLYYTGLIKFEKYFHLADFIGAYRFGFRSLYVGLESASERVLALMRKNTEQATMRNNLTDAAKAGIWMHCFAFFGFPGERHEDAQSTIDFIVGERDNIGSFGAGIFSLEHNAPIMRRLREHGVSLRPTATDDVDVYYEYDVKNGLTSAEATEYLYRLNHDAYDHISYKSTNWIPREQLLLLLSIFERNELKDACAEIMQHSDCRLKDACHSQLSYIDLGNAGILINRLNRVVLKVGGASKGVLDLAFEDDIPVAQLFDVLPSLSERLASKDAGRLSMHDSTKVI